MKKKIVFMNVEKNIPTGNSRDIVPTLIYYLFLKVFSKESFLN